MKSYNLVFEITAVVDGEEQTFIQETTADTEDAYKKALRNIPRRKGFVVGSLEVTETQTEDAYIQNECEAEEAELEAQTAAAILPVVEEVIEAVTTAAPSVAVTSATVETVTLTEDDYGVMQDKALWIPARRAAEYLQINAPQIFDRISRGRMQSTHFNNRYHVLRTEMEEWKQLRAAKGKGKQPQDATYL